MKKSVVVKIVGLLALMLIVAIVNIVIIYVYQDQQRDDAQIVNIAGRQRMLSQKISKLTLFVMNGREADRALLSQSIDLYDKTLKVLWHGGEAMGRKIPPASKEMEPLFKKNMVLWLVFKKNAETVVSDSRDNKVFQTAVDYVKDYNEILLKASDEVVNAYDTLPNAREFSHEINVAGRQRMLSQKMSKHAFGIAAGNDDERDDLLDAIELYESSLFSMLNGGVSSPWEGKVKPPPPSVKKSLKTVEPIWVPFKEMISLIHSESRYNEKFMQAVNFIH